MKYIFISLLCLLSFSGYAKDNTSNITSKATINKTCSLSASNISFGLYTPGQGDVFSTGSLQLLCTNGTSASIALNMNNSTISNDKYAYREGSTSHLRYMQNGTASLLYNLFQDSANSIVFGGTNWFVGTANARPVVIGDGTIKNITIYAAMSGFQYVKPGSYVDSIPVVVTF